MHRSAASFDVQATCDTGYVGTAVASACNSPNDPYYFLSGCTAAVICTQPADTTGYVNINNINLDLQNDYVLFTLRGLSAQQLLF